MKMEFFSKAIGALLVTAVIGCSGAALAEKGGQGHGKAKSESADNGEDHGRPGHDDNNLSGKIIISISDRAVIQRYIDEDYRSNCPPGLAKKHNGCLPPGQAKKQFGIGFPLAGSVVFQPVPQHWLKHLQPIPAGYRYVRVDRDVLLIAEASKMVIDAVTLLSAVGQ